MNKSLQSILIVVAIIAVAFGGFYFVKYEKVQKEIQTIKTDPSTTQKATAAETQKLIGEVGKLMELPKETPTIATVTDASKLKSQEFFQNAQNGDKVLIYTAEKKAILYRESLNKIVDVAPVNIGTPSATQQQAKVALLNGSDVSGASSKIETQIKTLYPGVEITSRDNAKAKYAKTTVVALNDAAKSAAANLAGDLKATVGNLPSGENKPTGADLLVIIGSDLAK